MPAEPVSCSGEHSGRAKPEETDRTVQERREEMSRGRIVLDTRKIGGENRRALLLPTVSVVTRPKCPREAIRRRCARWHPAHQTASFGPHLAAIENQVNPFRRRERGGVDVGATGEAGIGCIQLGPGIAERLRDRVIVVVVEPSAHC